MLASPKDASVYERPRDLFTGPLVLYLILSAAAFVALGAAARKNRGSARGGVLALLVAWVYSVQKLFMSAVGCVPEGALFSRPWSWLPVTVAVFAVATLLLNLFAVTGRELRS